MNWISQGLDIPGLVNPRSIGGLNIGPDGLLWGDVNGIVFAMDPDSLKIVKYKNLFPSDGPWGEWGSFEMQWEDGLLYMHLGRRLLVLDPITLDFKHLANSEAFAIGEDGHLYFAPHSMGGNPDANRTNMFRININDQQNPGKLHLNTDTKTYQQGKDKIEVTLYASQVNNLNSYEAVLSYDWDAMKNISIKPAGAFADDGAVFNAKKKQGNLEITASLPDGQQLDEDRAVAVLRFVPTQRKNVTEIVLHKESSVGSSAEVGYEMDTDEVISVRID